MPDSILDFTKASDTFISPSKKLSWYVWLLILSKFIRSCGLYLTFDILKETDLLHFVWLLSAVCSILFCLVQKPLAGAQKQMKHSTWLKVAKVALLRNIGLVLLFYGLSQIGPYRTSLLTEHSQVVLLAVYITILKGNESPRRVRGCICFILAVISLIFLDNDSSSSYSERRPKEGHLHYTVAHFFYAISWMGLSDHEGGLFIMVLVVIIMMYENRCCRRLSAEVGGEKRLNSLVWVVSFCLSTPPVLLLWILQVTSPLTPLASTHLVSLVALFYFFIDFYVNSTCSYKLSGWRAGLLSSLSCFGFSFFLSFIWPKEGNDLLHQISGGSVLSLLLFSAASFQLTSPGETSESLEGDFLTLHRSAVPNSFVSFVSSTLQSVLASTNSRTIFYFLCVNLGFTFVELLYGVWTNSLGLISDGFHMLFDCSALIMGLTASVMSHWKPTKTFPYGYGRIEVLSGFVNGLLLSVIGVMVLVEAMERMFEPPEIRTERLLIIATLGLIVNLCGVLAFRSSSHTHSHNGLSAGSSVVHAHSHNINMEGVFLHVLADTLGSVAVIVSSILVDWYGWLLADPICSIVLSILILSSVFPLVTNSAFVLLLGSPVGVKEVLHKVMEINSVLYCDSPHFWGHCDGKSIAALSVVVSGDVAEQFIMQQVLYILKEAGYEHSTVQIEIAKKHLPYISESSPWGLGMISKSPELNEIKDGPLAVNDV